MPKQNEKSAVWDLVFPLLLTQATTGLNADRLRAIELMLSHSTDGDQNDLIARIESICYRLDDDKSLRQHVQPKKLNGATKSA